MYHAREPEYHIVVTSPARAELRDLLRLAGPMVVAFLGQQMLGFVDTAMVGRLGSAAIGGVGIGNGIFFTITLVGMGCALGIDPLVTQALGAGENTHARRIYWQGLRVAGATALPLMAVVLVSTVFLRMAHVEPETAENARKFLYGRVWQAIPLCLFAVSRSYLQSTGHTRPIIISMLVANVVNFLADAILIYGDGALTRIGLPGIGLPALGVFGSGLASSFSAAIATILLFVAVSGVDAGHDPDRRRLDWKTLRSVFRLGLPIGMHMFVEVSAFAIAGVLSGRIGKEAAAANQVALILCSTTFMVPFAISTAVTVRVGRAIGKGDQPGSRRAALTGYAVSAVFMACAALSFIAAPGVLAGIFSDKPDVVAATIPLIQIAAFFQLSDGAQVMGAGILRGLGDTVTAFRVNVLGHFCIGLPIAIWLAFGCKMGVTGLWWGLSAGLTVVAIGLGLKYRSVAGKTIARVS